MMETKQIPQTIWEEINSIAQNIYDARNSDLLTRSDEINIKFQETDLGLLLYKIFGIEITDRGIRSTGETEKNYYGYQVKGINYKKRWFPVDVISDTITKTIKDYDYTVNDQFTGYFEHMLVLNTRNYFSKLSKKPNLENLLNENDEDINELIEFDTYEGSSSDFFEEPRIVYIGQIIVKHLANFERSFVNKKLFGLMYTHDSVNVIRDDNKIEWYADYEEMLFELFELVYINYLYVIICRTVEALHMEKFKDEIRLGSNGEVQEDEMAKFLVEHNVYKTFGVAKTTISQRRKLYYEFIRKYWNYGD